VAKQRPKGKYNTVKKWEKATNRNFINIENIDMLIYNDIDILDMYDKMDSLYTRKEGADAKVGRPKKNRDA
jgi:hypothetical protein